MTVIQEAARRLYNVKVGGFVQVMQGEDVLIELKRLDWDKCEYNEYGYVPTTDTCTWHYQRIRTISSLVAGH
jgi:hypothetical protein